MAEALAAGNSATKGVVEHGLFLNMADAAIIAAPAGVRMLTLQV